MPAAFPPSKRGNSIQDVTLVNSKPLEAKIVQAPIFGRPNKPQDGWAGQPVSGIAQKNPNVRNLGRDYTNVQDNARPNPITPKLPNAPVHERKTATINRVIAGVSRDSVGAILGNCRVLIFRTSDNTLLAELLSDAGGIWRHNTFDPGPFFLVEYKAGAPDLAGTSVNTLTTAET